MTRVYTKKDMATEYAAALADYVSREKSIETICADHHISKQTLARAVRSAGIQRRKGSGEYAKRLREPGQLEGAAFDKFRVVPESKCECGTDCGFTFRRVIGQRNRKFHPDCPAAKARDAEKKREYSRRAEAKKKAKAPPRNLARGKAPDISPRPRVPVCKVCYNLPHARKNPKCDGCGFPFQPTPSFENHRMLQNMPENTESEWR